jgi:hypothetical protein
MSVSSSTSQISYAGNTSAVTAYPIPFPFQLTADITAVLITVSGAATPLVNGTDFTVTGGGGLTGSLVTAVAVINTSTVTIFRAVPVTQLSSFTTGDKLPAKAIEYALDKLTMILQQIALLVSPNSAFASGSAPFVLGLGAVGGSPAWVPVSTAPLADGAITPVKLSTGHPTWDAAGNLTATSFNGSFSGTLAGNSLNQAFALALIFG